MARKISNMKFFVSDYRYFFFGGKKIGDLGPCDDNLWVDEKSSYELDPCTWRYEGLTFRERLDELPGKAFCGSRVVRSGIESRKITLQADFETLEGVFIKDRLPNYVSCQSLREEIDNFLSQDRVRLTIDGEKYINIFLSKSSAGWKKGSNRNIFWIRLDLLCPDPCFYSMGRSYLHVPPTLASGTLENAGDLPAYPHWTTTTYTHSPRAWSLNFSDGTHLKASSRYAGGYYNLDYDSLNGICYRTNRSDPGYIGKNQLLHLFDLDNVDLTSSMSIPPSSSITISRGSGANRVIVYWRNRWSF